MWPPESFKKKSKKSNINKNTEKLNIKFVSDINPDEVNNFTHLKKGETAFVILTRFTGRELFEFEFEKNSKKISIKEFPDVISSVQRINKYYPNNQIIVIDADSPDKSYQNQIKEIDPTVIIEDIKNKNYETGGVIYAFKKYQKYFKSFFFLQDSILLNHSIFREVFNVDKNFWYTLQDTNCGWCHRADFNQTKGEWEVDEKSDFIIRDTCVFKDGIYNPIHVDSNVSSSTDKDIISSYRKAFNIAYCISFLIATETLKKVLNTNIIKISPLPNKKIGSSAWERIWALAFAQCGLKSKNFEGSNIIHWFGNCAGGRGANHTTKFTKFYLGRK